MLQEFKKFAMRGNVIDLAVGVIIGGAFGKIVTSLVNDIVMPIMGILTGGIDFKRLKWVISGKEGTEVAIHYGQFIQATVDFLIIAFSIFMVIKALSKFKKKEEKEEKAEKAVMPTPTNEELLLKEIRDILRDKA